MQVRRILTGHDDQGRAIFLGDEVIAPGELGTVVWTTAAVPADNAEASGGEARAIGITAPGGSAVRMMSIAPGQRSPMHRTQTIDYGVVLEGEVDLELEDGAVKTVRAGDVVVQRGTIHAWINRSSAPCKVAFVLIAAEPLVVGGRTLAPTHL